MVVFPTLGTPIDTLSNGFGIAAIIISKRPSSSQQVFLRVSREVIHRLVYCTVSDRFTPPVPTASKAFMISIQRAMASSCRPCTWRSEESGKLNEKKYPAYDYYYMVTYREGNDQTKQRCLHCDL